MKWFDNLKIRSKLLLVFGILIFITLMFSVFAVTGIINVGDSLNELINSYQTRQVHISEAITTVYKIRMTNFSKWYTAESNELENSLSSMNHSYSENVRSFYENMFAYRDLVLSDRRLSEEEKLERVYLMNKIIDLFEHYLANTGELDASVAKSDHDEIIRILERSVPLGINLSEAVQGLCDVNIDTTRQKAAETLATADNTLETIFLIAALCLAMSCVIVFFTIKNINLPISNLEIAVREIAKGNLSYPIRTERRDELGSLANYTGDMIDKIVSYSQNLNIAKMASAAKSAFLANMSHEIRTPMNAILGITEIQLQDETLSPGIKEALNRIYSSGDLLLSIINDILDLSKIEAGKLELSPVKYEVASLINDTVSLNMMRIGSKPIVFKLAVDAKMPSVLIGDDLRIRQILNNLLSNAFKYTPHGIVSMSVSAETNDRYDSETTLVLTVSDTGMGMNEEQINKLFDEYSRFNEEANRTTEGTGLGMSITQNLVKMMNGKISVKSEVNQGTTISVYLPQKKADSRVMGIELAESLQNFRLNDAKQIRKAQIVYEPMPYGSVLIVDDAESNLYVAKGLLAPYDLCIETASSGFEAIEKIREGRVYNIVFMDHMMPRMDGIEAVDKIRKLGYKQPIIALTANAVVGQANVFLTNGFDGFISKPIDMRQLGVVLKQFVRDRQPHEVVEAARRRAIEEKGHKADKSKLKSLDPQLAEFFVHDASRAAAALELILAKDGGYDEQDIRAYIVNTHAMKSALRNINEPELSAAAAQLEQAGRNNNTAAMKSETRAFLDKLRELTEELTPPEQEKENAEMDEKDFADLREKLHILINACGTYDKKNVKALIIELRQKPWPQQINKMLETMAELLLNGDFGEVAKTADKIISAATQA